MIEQTLHPLTGGHNMAIVMAKNLPANAEDGRDVGLIPWRRKWQPTPVFLPGQSHVLRSGLQSTGSQRVGHGWATELDWTEKAREQKTKRRGRVNIWREGEEEHFAPAAVCFILAVGTWFATLCDFQTRSEMIHLHLQRCTPLHMLFDYVLSLGYCI